MSVDYLFLGVIERNRLSLGQKLNGLSDHSHLKKTLIPIPLGCPVTGYYKLFGIGPLSPLQALPTVSPKNGSTRPGRTIALVTIKFSRWASDTPDLKHPKLYTHCYTEI